MTQEMTAYYARRAAEYERVYTGPRWQGDLARLRPRVAKLKNLFDRTRLEPLIAPHAVSVSYRELQFFWRLEYVVA